MSTTSSITEFDLIVVGAGIIGCSASRAFALDGRKVLLLERDLSEPDRIVGELLQPGGINALKELGMEDCVEGMDGIPCYGRNNWKKGSGKIFSSWKIYFKLKKGCHLYRKVRKRLIKRVVTVKELTVTSLIKEENGRVIGATTLDKSNQEYKFYAPLTIVCDGIFSKFRKEMTVKKPDVRSNFVGFIIKDLELPLPNHGHVILAKPSPILMYQISTRDTRVLVDIPGKLPSSSDGSLKKYMENIVAPELPDTIREKFLEALETERLRSMPNGFLPPSINQVEGMIMLGDAMNIRHPLTGGGMTVAFNDVVLLKELLAPENIPSLTDTEAILQQMSTFHWRRKKYCTAINVLAMALYRIFAADDNKDLAVLLRGCYSYFQLGGECVDAPVGLLSGLIRRPMVLVYHFFSVAFYSIYLEAKSKGWSGIHHSFIMIITVLYTACITIVPYLWSETQY